MLPQKPLSRDGHAPLFPRSPKPKSPSTSGHLDQKVNQDVSPDNIWEKSHRPPNDAGGRYSRCIVKISCPACAAKYSIADEKVQDKLAKIRCRKCSTTIVIDGKVNPPNVFAGEASQVDSPAVSDPGNATPSSVAASGEYSVDFGDNDQRSLSIHDLVSAYNSGEVTAETFVWADGMDDWMPLGQVPAIVDALNAAASAPAASAPAAVSPAAPAAAASKPDPAAAPWEPKINESPSAVRAAARAGGGRGSTSDLFGAYETAGSEADVTTSAREPTPAPAVAQPAGATTGARNESSVLFSLSALTASAKPSTPSASASTASSLGSMSSGMGSSGSGTKTKEDSGLIDLKALTAAAEPAAAAPMMGPSPLGMAPPLGLAPPIGGVEAQIPMPQQRSRTGLYIGGGIAVAAVAIAVAIVVTSMKPPPPPPVPVATQAPPPAPTPTPEATESTTAKAPATGTAEDKPPDDKTAKNNTATKRPTGGRPVAKQPTGDTPAKPKGDAPKKPAKNPCGCASGDLQCAMKCAAGGG